MYYKLSCKSPQGGITLKHSSPTYLCLLALIVLRISQSMFLKMVRGGIECWLCMKHMVPLLPDVVKWRSSCSFPYERWSQISLLVTSFPNVNGPNYQPSIQGSTYVMDSQHEMGLSVPTIHNFNDPFVRTINIPNFNDLSLSRF